MPASDPKKLAGIFISYRRSDAPDAVGRIYDRLVSEFGKARVFKDVDSIPLGQDFRGHLNEIVGGCAAVLTIIGPKWTDARNESGERRLENPDDFVRIELEAALARKVPVVPVLVGHAVMPVGSLLPESLMSLIYRQAIEVRPDPDFHNDATRLVWALRLILDPNARAVTPLLSHQKWVTAFAVVAAVAAAALVIPALKHLREAPPLETRTEIGVEAQYVEGPSMALSPDGSQIVFGATTNGVSRLWLRALAATTAQPLPGTEGGILPFWSPDSRSIGFFSNTALKRLDVGGGAPLTLAPVTLANGGSWNADGVILFSQYGKGLLRLAATGGAVAQVTPLIEGATFSANPEFLPDGRRFICWMGGGNTPGLYLGSLDGVAPVRLTTFGGRIAYLSSGWVLIWNFTRQVLVAQRLDADKGALVGAPVILAEGRGSVSTSATGLVAYWKASIQGERQLQWRSRTGAELGTIGEPNGYDFLPRVAPDGNRVAVSRIENSKHDVWLMEGDRASRLTFEGGADNTDPIWSPDGTRIVFGSQRPDAQGLYQKSADGTGEEQLLLQVDLSAAPTSWSSDGRYLMYSTLNAGTNWDIGVLPMTGDRKPWVFLTSSFWESSGEFSPDGKWISYDSDETGQREVYIRPFVVPGDDAMTARSGKWQISLAGGTYPKWGPDGKELFFLNPDGEMMAAPISYVGSGLTPGKPMSLFPTRVYGGGAYKGGPQYDVTRDGRFMVNTVLGATAPESPPIILIQNWNPDAGE